MISALQHLLFCRRQCALIHVEQLWEENPYTAEGRIMHRKVDQSVSVSRRNVRSEYSLRLCSSRLGLIGIADVVEFHRREGGQWTPYPVEYKRGRPKKNNSDRVQLCAQAMCLEEMIGIQISEGALFYGQRRRRQTVSFSDALRDETRCAARELHELINSGITPGAEYSEKCEHCSLLSLCLPQYLDHAENSVEQYFKEQIGE